MNEIRLREMVPLAMYETKEGSRNLKICKYYKSDYIAMQMIKTFFLTTIAYVLVLMLLAAGNIDWLLDHIDNFDPLQFGSVFVMFYIVMMALYLVLTFVFSKKRYEEARRSVHEYEVQLKKLDMMARRSDGDSETGKVRRSRR